MGLKIQKLHNSMDLKANAPNILNITSTLRFIHPKQGNVHGVATVLL